MIKFALFILLSAQTLSGCSNTKMNQEKNQHNKVINNLQIMPDSCTRCDILVVKQTESLINKLKYTDLHDFLYTFSKDCSKNVEYSEYSNEMLFKVLEKYPEELIDCMSKEKELDLDYIYSELSTPLLDINAEIIYEKVQNALGNKNVKEKVLEALKKAKDY